MSTWPYGSSRLSSRSHHNTPWHIAGFEWPFVDPEWCDPFHGWHSAARSGSVGAVVLRVRQQVQRIDGVLREVELKTDASERDEPLLPTARDVLQEQREQQTAKRRDAGATWQGTGDDRELVFTTSSGRPLEARNLSRSYHRICKQHGIRPVGLHGMRHTNATTQKNLHVHDRDIQAILGHGDLRTTGVYVHVDMSSKRNALRKVEEQLFGHVVDGNG